LKRGDDVVDDAASHPLEEVGVVDDNVS